MGHMIGQRLKGLRIVTWWETRTKVEVQVIQSFFGSHRMTLQRVDTAAALSLSSICSDRMGRYRKGKPGLGRGIWWRSGIKGSLANEIPDASPSLNPGRWGSECRGKGIDPRHQQHDTREHHPVGREGHQPGWKWSPSGLDSSNPHGTLEFSSVPFSNHIGQLEVLDPGIESLEGPERSFEEDQSKHNREGPKGEALAKEFR